MSQFQTWSFNAMQHILYDMKVADIPGDFMSMFTKDKKTNVRWSALIKLIAALAAINALYKKM